MFFDKLYNLRQNFKFVIIKKFQEQLYEKFNSI